MKPAYLTYVLKHGKYFGQTLAMIAKKDPGYIQWLAALPGSNKGFKREVVQAAKAYIASPEWQRVCPLVSIPAEILADRRLSLGARVLFGVIYTAAQQDEEGCRLSNDALRDQTGLSLKQVKHLLRLLEKENLVKRTVDGGRRPQIDVLWSPEPRGGRGGKRVPSDEDTAVPPRRKPASPPRVRLRGDVDARGQTPEPGGRPTHVPAVVGPLMEVVLRNGLSTGPFSGASETNDPDATKSRRG